MVCPAPPPSHLLPARAHRCQAGHDRARAALISWVGLRSLSSKHIPYATQYGVYTDTMARLGPACLLIRCRLEPVTRHTYLFCSTPDLARPRRLLCSFPATSILHAAPEVGAQPGDAGGMSGMHAGRCRVRVAKSLTRRSGTCSSCACARSGDHCG